MRAIVISIPDGVEPADCGEYVQWVGSQLKEGFTSGHIDRQHHWSIEDSEAVKSQPRVADGVLEGNAGVVADG